MSITLIVKGDRFVAAMVAAARRIPFTFVRSIEDFGETVGTTDDASERAVQDWYAANLDPAPFPPGSLLAYAGSDPLNDLSAEMKKPGRTGADTRKS